MQKFIFIYSVLIILSSIFINGFYNITRGWWVTNPGGSKRWQGKIFSKYGKWLQQHQINAKVYKGDEFLKIVDKVKEFFVEGEIIEISQSIIYIKITDQVRLSLMKAFFLSKEVCADIVPVPNGIRVYFYKEEKDYYLPFLLRYPLGECLSCMSSFFGTLCWIFWYQLLVQTNSVFQDEGIAILLALPFIAKVGLWIFFCTSLTWWNEFIFNLNTKFSK